MSLDAALSYFRRGWSIIPIQAGTKKAAVPWKRYQAERADEQTVRQWFASASTGIAVVLGAISDGLVCRDFDSLAAYDKWAAGHADLAGALPTVATARGRNVYFRPPSADLRFVDLRLGSPPEDGEYRGDSGHYCLLPPSIHPSGSVYTWLVPLSAGPVPFVPDVQAVGLLPTRAIDRDNRENRVSSPLLYCFSNPQSSSVLSVTSISGDSDVDGAILATLPEAPGRRNRQLFEFARALKAFPRFTECRRRS